MAPDIQVVTNPGDVAALLDPTQAGLNPELGKTLADIEKDKRQKEEDALKLAQIQEKSKPKQQPITLKYIFVGNCPNCNSDKVKTLMVENEAGYFAVCYCLQEDVQLQSVKVTKLDTPKK